MRNFATVLGLFGIVFLFVLGGCATPATKATPATEATEARPQDSMVKISYLMRRLPHLSREEFQTYWRDKHPRAVDESAFGLLGIRRYIQVHTLDTSARDAVIGPRSGLVDEFDGVAEIWVDSTEAIQRDWSTQEAAHILRAFFEDEQNFIDWSRSTITVSKEIIMME